MNLLSKSWQDKAASPGSNGNTCYERKHWGRWRPDSQGWRTASWCREISFTQPLRGYLSDHVLEQPCQLFLVCGDFWGGGKEKMPQSEGYGCFTLWYTALLSKMDGKVHWLCQDRNIKVCLHWSVKQDLDFCSLFLIVFTTALAQTLPNDVQAWERSPSGV